MRFAKFLVVATVAGLIATSLATVSIGAVPSAGDCWDETQKKSVNPDPVEGEYCQTPGSFCVSDDDCAFVNGPNWQYRTVTDRKAVSSCSSETSTIDCLTCPSGSQLVCATFDAYDQKNLETGECQQFVGRKWIYLGTCTAPPEQV